MTEDFGHGRLFVDLLAMVAAAVFVAAVVVFAGWVGVAIFVGWLVLGVVVGLVIGPCMETEEE